MLRHVKVQPLDVAVEHHGVVADEGQVATRGRRAVHVDGNQVIELYHLEGLNCSDNMTIAYLPKEKIVVNAELIVNDPRTSAVSA